MFKGGFCQAQKAQFKANVPQGNKTPTKNRQPITRSPIKDRRSRSPYSKSPIRRQTKCMLSPAYNPPYVKINYMNVKSPNKQRTPLKDLKVAMNTEQIIMREQSKYSPHKLVTVEPHIQRIESTKGFEQREFKLKNYQFFSKATHEIKESNKKGSNRKENHSKGDSGKRHPLINKIEDVKFIAVNYFNPEPHTAKLHKVKKQNVPNMHYFNEMKKPVEKFIGKQFSEQEAEKKKVVVTQSHSHLDRVMMSFDPQLNDPQLNMDPFL